MLALTFNAFQEGSSVPDGISHPCEDYKIYVVRDDKHVLYVGMTMDNVWNRWFDSRSPHMIFSRNYPKSLFLDELPQGYSLVGRHIASHYPASLNWIIELWSVKDCAELCSDTLSKSRLLWLLANTYTRDAARQMEMKMIRRLHPKLNATCNN